MSPSIEELQAAARTIVLNAEKASDLTTNVVCAQVEKQFRLTESLLNDSKLKKPLKAAIQDAISERRIRRKAKEAGETSSSNPTAKEDTPSSTNAGSTGTTKQSGSKKFKSASVVATSDSEQDEPVASSSKPLSKAPRPASKTKIQESKPDKTSAKSSKLVPNDNTERKPPPKAKILSISDDDDDNDKEMAKSPPQTKKRKTNASSDKSDKPPPKKRVKKEENKDEATVKRLKSYVFACGVRKPWAKTFEGVDKPSAQINILKKILTELGMTGRFSLEQAKRIKEQRELAQDLEEVQTFEKQTRERGPRRGDKAPVVEENASVSDEDEDDEMERPTKRKTARQSIMAFLANQSDSD